MTGRSHRPESPATASGLRVRVVGRRSVLVELADQAEVHRLWSAWRSRAGMAPEIPGDGGLRGEDVEEVVAGLGSILVTVRAGRDPQAVLRRLRGGEDAAAPADPREVMIPVVYDGPDLAGVAGLTGLSPAEVVRRHSSARYSVAFLGFSPGFAYLTGGDPVLEVPRLDRPRTAVPAGSVATAAGLSAVYPQSTPGGWRLLGRTEAVMFDPHRAAPAVLAPGDVVRFDPVRARLRALAADPEAARDPALAPGSGTSRNPTPAPDPAPAAPAANPARPDPPIGRPAGRPYGPPGGRYFRVLQPGPLLTVQDRGRVGWAHVGVPRAGAADRTSAAAANHLVGNHGDAALIEATLVGPHLLVGSACLVAVTGAPAPVTVDGLPARQDRALALPAGSVLTVGPLEAGLRVYIAVDGGVAVEAVLGSRSTDTLAGIGPPPLRAGDVVPLGPPGAGGPGTPPRPQTPMRPSAGVGAGIEVRAAIGPRHDRVGPAGMEILGRAEFVVQPASDRTGVRLGGPTVPVEPLGEILSEPMVAGAIQIPHGGSPIVLLRNHPTTGGYPVAAVVDEAGIDRLAQARPGDRVRIRLEPPG